MSLVDLGVLLGLSSLLLWHKPVAMIDVLTLGTVTAIVSGPDNRAVVALTAISSGAMRWIGGDS